MTMILVLYTIPNDLSAVLSARVSNELGAGRSWVAKATGGWDWHGPHRGHFKGNTLVHGLQCVGCMFTGEQEVVGYVSQCILFIAILVLLNSMEAIFSGSA